MHVIVCEECTGEQQHYVSEKQQCVNQTCGQYSITETEKEDIVHVIS